MFRCSGPTFEVFEDAMNAQSNAAASRHRLTRRQLVTAAAIAMGGIASKATLLGEAPQQPLPEKPGTTATSNRTSLHDEVMVKTSPQRIYELLLDAKQFAALTRGPAEIDPKAGGAFSMFGGLIVGRNIELVPNQRIVQAWRPSSWDPGIYSLVRFELKPHSYETLIVLDHSSFPEGDFKHLEWGWNAHYWEPMKKRFS
jgi:activator of HSP90 ATPase